MKIRFTFLFWICCAMSASSIQYSTSVIDSCISIDDVSDTTFYRTLYLFTDTGNFYESDIRNSFNGPWVYSYGSSLTLSRSENVLDSLNRISESVRYIRVLNTWQLSERRLYSYNVNGNITDSIYQQYTNTWINVSWWNYQYDLNYQLIHYVRKDWINNSWQNSESTEWFRDGNGNDTLKIYYAGNGSQWDTASLERKIYDVNNNLLSNQLMNYAGSTWTNQNNFVYTYDSQNRVETKIQQSWNGSSWSDTMRFYYSYPFPSRVHIIEQYWLMSAWNCHYYYDTTFISPNSYHAIQGIFQYLSCTDSIVMNEDSLDSFGRLVHHYEYHLIGESYSDSYYEYDSTGFLYHSYGFSSSMGGFTYNSECYNFRPLIIEQLAAPASICQGDSMSISAGIYSGNPPYSFDWKLNSVALPDTTQSIFISSANDGDIYTVTVTDSSNNTYESEFTVVTGANPNLGQDTTICINGTINLMPGTFATYQWQDGSADSVFLVSNPGLIPDTMIYWVQVTLASGCSNTDSVTVIFDACLGMDEAGLSDSKIYPNPVQNGILNIDDENIESIIISDMMGRKVFETKNSESFIYVGNLDPGTYLITVKNNKRMRFEKIIIK